VRQATIIISDQLQRSSAAIICSDQLQGRANGALNPWQRTWKLCHTE
jgi:hypothetical protein